jgi:hypothetical protein
MKRTKLAIALFLLALAIYALTGPGRIDSFDGQYRFDIALNLLSTGKPELRDPVLLSGGITGTDGRRYIGYGPAPSYLAVPLVFAGLRFGDPDGELARFLFSFQNTVAAAATVALLALFFAELGSSARRSALLALVVAFGSLLWIGATTVLEQGQHALFALLGAYLAWKAARVGSYVLALAGGVAAGTLALYQLPYAILLPLLGLATLRPVAEHAGFPRWNESVRRYVLFGAGSAVAVATAMLYNFNRFGTLLYDPRDHLGTHPPVEGNPLVGVPTLLFGPGKGLLLYSPIAVLFLLGFGRLIRRERWLAVSALAASTLHLFFVGSLSFFHGDWCWGPRYLVVLTPLLALGLPTALEGATRRRRLLAVALVGWSAFSNVLGLALVHERFFLEAGLPIYFWKDDAAFYWRNSAYFHRVEEIVETIREGMPSTATAFTISPYAGRLTYVLVPGGSPRPDPSWMRELRIFYRPRPWPLWLGAERDGWARGRGFAGYWGWVVGFAALGAAGLWLLRSTLRSSDAAGDPAG